ncbi:MAG: AraC family transcriptional regulator ligand-binding domain-containing protein [Alphaproteobacteria bacterium]|nr:AraC family transcriptional regulator ligand-binding domain-containing protein [Alphaproteobacteria bacterium]
MAGIPLTRASQLIHVTNTLERHGLSAERMLEDAKLPMWHFCDPDDLIPTHHIYTLLDRTARKLGNPAFGLLVGADNSVATLGTFGRLIANSLTTYHSFATSCRLIYLHTSAAHNWLTEAGDVVWFWRSQFRGPEAGRWQLEQYVLMRLIEHVRMGAGPSWQPAKVCLQTHEPPGVELREALGDPEIFIGQKVTGIAVPRPLLAWPLKQRGIAPLPWPQDAQARLQRTAPAFSFVDTLRQVAGTLLKEGHPQVGPMAEITGLTIRTLQRRLASENLTFSQLVDQARFQAACSLLEDDMPPVTDIAMELGYSDSAHFTRAFKRWAGVTPRQYRRIKLEC